MRKHWNLFSAECEMKQEGNSLHLSVQIESNSTVDPFLWVTVGLLIKAQLQGQQVVI